jgi:hypothetical protein
MKQSYTFVLLFFSLSVFSQFKIDGSFSFQSDQNKKYSLYIPAGYNPNVPHKAMLAMHPLNTSRWNAKSWRDTLTEFASSNNLILICPDGGSDGSVIDPIDLNFTTALLDSMNIWYSIDSKKVYIMGFSFGGLATYLYGLNNADRFGGFMPIGAAVNGTNDVNGIIQFSKNKAFFLIHGSLDNPNTRFFPIRSALTNQNAILRDSFLQGIGHTIDFPNRNEILSFAYKWLDSVNCAQIVSTVDQFGSDSKTILLFPSIISSGGEITIHSELFKEGYYNLILTDASSKRIETKQIVINPDSKLFRHRLPQLLDGIYILTIKRNHELIGSAKILVKS